MSLRTSLRAGLTRSGRRSGGGCTDGGGGTYEKGVGAELAEDVAGVLAVVVRNNPAARN